MARTILASLLVAIFALLVAACAKPLAPGSPRELRLAYAMAPGGAAHEAAGIFAKLVDERTTSQIGVKLFPSAQLGNERELSEAISVGNIDMVLIGAAPIGWYLPQYGAIEAPFLFRDYAHMDQVLGGETGREIGDAFLAKRKVRILDWWHRGPRYLTTTNRKVAKPADLKGLKLRVPELPTYIEAWRILGTNPTPITYSEIFMALKQGIVEGQENPLEVIYTSSFHEVQKYLMKTEHLLGFYMLMINAGVFDSLSPEHQKAIRDAAVEAGRREHELMIQYDAEFTAKMKGSGVEFVDVDREAFRRAVVSELPRRFAGQWAPNFFERIVGANQ